MLREPAFLVDSPATRDPYGVLKPGELLGWVRDRNDALEAARGGYRPTMLLARLASSQLTEWHGGVQSPFFESVGLHAGGANVTEGDSEGAGDFFDLGVPAGLFFGVPATAGPDGFTPAAGLEITLAKKHQVREALAEVKARADAALRLAGFDETAALPELPELPKPAEGDGEEEAA